MISVLSFKDLIYSLISKSSTKDIALSLLLLFRIYRPPDYGSLKINTDVTFKEAKVNNDIIIRNHIGIPLFTKANHELEVTLLILGSILEIFQTDQTHGNLELKC